VSDGPLEAEVALRRGGLTLDVRLEAARGTTVVVGPNGAGKTTLLLALLGVLRPERGRVQIGGDVLCDAARGVHVPVELRRLGWVPQGYALYPHRDVRGQLLHALASAPDRPTRAERRRRADGLIAELGLEALAARRPDTLSGGERQRVALARALSVRPRALLLDEPLAALDVRTRRAVRASLRAWLEALAIPTLLVTHDAEDARALGERVVVLEAGRVVQTGGWQALAERPATPFVAALAAPRAAPDVPAG